MANITFILTDYVQNAPKLQTMMARSIARETSYVVSYGNIRTMKKTDPHEDSINGITNLIAEQYMKGRYNHVVTMSLYDKTDTMENVSIASLDDTFDIIDANYAGELPVLFINIIPRQIYQNQKEELAPALAESAIDVFRRYGFMDCGCKLKEGIEVPSFVTVRANGIGSVALTEANQSNW